MDAEYDAAVIGLGAMGSAALAKLASRGLRVLGIDALDPPVASAVSGGSTGRPRLQSLSD